MGDHRLDSAAVDAWAGRDGDRSDVRCQGRCREPDHDCRRLASADVPEWPVENQERLCPRHDAPQQEHRDGRNAEAVEHLGRDERWADRESDEPEARTVFVCLPEAPERALALAQPPERRQRLLERRVLQQQPRSQAQRVQLVSAERQPRVPVGAPELAERLGAQLPVQQARAQEQRPVAWPRASEAPWVEKRKGVRARRFPATDGGLYRPRQRRWNWSAFSFRLRRSRARGR
jgi:hypothetical protein